jgi:hypothetical protein
LEIEKELIKNVPSDIERVSGDIRKVLGDIRNVPVKEKCQVIVI